MKTFRVVEDVTSTEKGFSSVTFLADLGGEGVVMSALDALALAEIYKAVGGDGPLDDDVTWVRHCCTVVCDDDVVWAGTRATVREWAAYAQGIGSRPEFCPFSDWVAEIADKSNAMSVFPPLPF